MHIPNPYTLPPIDFIGGSTQEFVFHCYFYAKNKPHDLSSCTAEFAIINFVNKHGEPPVHKLMDIGSDISRDGEVRNVLRVTITPNETVDLPAGKYIYQITIKDIAGDVEIPNQGIVYIVNNIDKEFVKKILNEESM